MNQQPDKLFREKLEGYQMPAPASAWEKIAAAQSKKNDKWLWLKIAASIAFVAVAGYLLWSQKDATDVSQQLSTIDEEKITKDLPQSQKKTAEEIKDNTPTSAQPAVASNKPTPPSETGKKASHKPVLSKPDEIDLNTTVSVKAIEEPVLQDVAVVENSDDSQIEETPAVSKVEPRKITLVYSAKDVEEYLDKKSLAQATSDNKKSSTLKKLLKKANDLTNNQDPFGELRQMKNEILALNFKNEKQRGQNK